MINNYQIIIEYLGTDYVGWQRQKNGISIQLLIEKALGKTLNSKIKINGSGRTDAGVHAIAQSANFLFKEEIIYVLFLKQEYSNSIKKYELKLK